MPKYISKSVKDTQQIAQTLAQNTKSHIFALSGDLGSGKTTFVQGFAKGLGIKDKIISPTFVLIRQHQIPNKNKLLYHVDLYRLENKEDIKLIGLKELLNQTDNLVLIEWPEKILDLLPKEAVYVSISQDQHQKRLITIS